ncbi:hypothetical protein B5M09_003132 [Aphanomyces astaci]|uniref:Phosphodiesterase n=1 Tax=Aphanomyces astaci TaxID=112090 RepID=A0A3R7YLR7_APHAT|nr:hypothetical protein B5M09_003132 [Aphanomyces astaci]
MSPCVAGQVVTTNNVDEHPCFDRELDERTGNSTKKLLCVPVKDPDGTILAVVQAVNKVDKSDFSIEDTLFLNYIAEAAGISLHKSYLHNEVIIAKRLTDVRLKLSDYVLNHNDIHSLTDLIMVHGKAIMDCDRFGFLLVDHLKNELWITSNNGNLGEQVTLRQPIYKGISGLVATTGETVCTRDAYTHSLFDPTHDNITGYRTTSVLCMPVFEEHVPTKPKVVAVAIDRNLSGSSEVTEAGVISSLLQKHSRNTSGIMTANLTQLDGGGDHRVADDVFAHDVKLTQRPELDSWDLDILSFSFTEVIQSVQTLFRAYGFIDTYEISPDKMQSFVASVAQHYRANSYHNFYHAFQVLHSAHIQLKVHMRKLLTGLDIFALMIAALCHDVDHPGNNNDFEVKCVSSIALTHNDDAVLERHHCRVTFLILNTPSTNILEKVAPDAFRSIRRTIIRCIMATDMANHFTQCKALENMSRHQLQDAVNRMVVMELIVHASDLSAQALPYKLAFKWGDRALDEFQNQAREEADMNLPVAPFMENLESKGARLSVQSNFICYVLQPLWTSYGLLVPQMRVRRVLESVTWSNLRRYAIKLAYRLKDMLSTPRSWSCLLPLTLALVVFPHVPVVTGTELPTPPLPSSECRVIVEASSAAMRFFVMSPHADDSNDVAMSDPLPPLTQALHTMAPAVAYALMKDTLHELSRQHINAKVRPGCPLHIVGTSGMRELPEARQSDIYDAIYASYQADESVDKLPLDRYNLRTLPEDEESYLLTVAANFLDKRIGKDMEPSALQLYGIVDLDPSSVRLVMDVEQRWRHNVRKKAYRPTPLTQSEFLAQPRPSGPFYALNELYQAASFAHSTLSSSSVRFDFPTPSRYEMEQAATALCALPYKVVTKSNENSAQPPATVSATTSPSEQLRWKCLDLCYSAVLLKQLGLTDDERRVLFVESVHGRPVHWVLGAHLKMEAERRAVYDAALGEYLSSQVELGLPVGYHLALLVLAFAVLALYQMVHRASGRGGTHAMEFVHDATQ